MEHLGREDMRFEKKRKDRCQLDILSRGLRALSLLLLFSFSWGCSKPSSHSGEVNHDTESDNDSSSEMDTDSETSTETEEGTDTESEFDTAPDG